MCIILRKTAVFCIFILLVIGLFLTCDDPSGSNNPFTNNMGDKVAVEPPTIDDISPVSGSYLRGKVTFTAKAKAYIKVEKVEVYIYEDKVNGQKEVKWNSNGIRLLGNDIKRRNMEFDFDTSLYNNFDFTTGEKVTTRDGPIRMKFRIFDSTGIKSGKYIEERAVESIDLIYIIKNNPSVIKMAYPSDAAVEKASEPANVPWGGDIRGSITDRRGIRPGFPQIKLWPDGETEPGDEGWATLFLTGYDDMEKEGADENTFPAGHGRYEDRRKLRVVNAASFSLRLAEYDIIPPDPENPDLRRVSYKFDDSGKKHKLFEPNALYRFKIRTRDVAPDPFKGSIPSEDPEKPWPDNPDGTPWTPWLEGFYPPKDFGTGNVNWFEMRASGGVEEPVRIRVFSSDTRPTVEINNDDIGEGELKLKPNKYITEPISKKIVKNGFRLRLFATFEKSTNLILADLKYEHSSTTKRGGDLNWDEDPILYTHKDGRPGTLFTYTADPAIFTNSSDPYILIFRVHIDGFPEEEWPEYRYVVYMDGVGPNVSIRSIQGSADAKSFVGDKDVDYVVISNIQDVVNGNIQAVVDRTDDSGIMAYRENADLGMPPPGNETGYPMVKWIVEEATAEQTRPPENSNSIGTLLKNYKDEPTWDNFRFFRDIIDTQSSSLTSLPSGWVRRPLSEADAVIDADKNDHFKLNTNRWDKKYLWIYVIAMDQVQNLGAVARKIYIDQDTDKPKPETRPLEKKNAGDKDIVDDKSLDVTVTIQNTGTSVTRTMTGNWTGTLTDGKRNNVLGRNEGIGLNFIDDDGINLDSGGVTISLTDLNVTPNTKITLTAAQVKKVLNETANTGSKKDMSGTLSQELMAEFFGLKDEKDEPLTSLYDGLYKIEITVKDDIDQKVKITPHTIDGDTPEVAYSYTNPSNPADHVEVYYFAVSTDKPEITIIKPDDNALGGAEPQDIFGTVRSRLNIQSMWITFTPNVVPPHNPKASSGPISLPITPVAGKQPDAEGYYEYTWERKSVVFHPMGVNLDGDLRRFTVEAYDRLANLSEVVRTVQVDDSKPEITLIEFNYSRPVDPEDGKLYLYGKVPFTLSASDTNGMYEVINADGVKMSGIKWWVFEKNDTALAALEDKQPVWSTPFRTYTKAANSTLPATAPSTWTGGGNFSVAQALSGGKYTAIIDTRYLMEKAEYVFYYMAMDKAGNTQLESVVLQPDISVFTIDQTRDYPVIYENTLNPLPDSVLGNNNLFISGTVSDADLFNNANRNTYVEIRYPTITDNAPVWNNPWIRIPISATYSAKDGGIDPAGAIVYKFDPSTNAGANTYFSSDGIKYYQIRVTDEPVGPTDAEKAAGAKWYGKNPDLFMTTAGNDQTETPATNPNYGKPIYPNYPYVYHDKVSIVFPLDTANPLNPTPNTSFKFYVDNTKPEIYFNLHDPTVGHENYSATLRPTFSKYDQLITALGNTPKNGKGNYVKEYKLIDLTMSWSAGDSIFTKVILNNPPDPAVAGEYPWDLTGFTAEDKTRLETIFNAAPQGMQVISFEATDLVPLAGRVSWIFAKDTQGPEINFNTISRSIKRTTIPAPTAGQTAKDVFPAGWPPEVAEWKTAWDSFSWSSVTWKNITTNWPSEYAFKAAADVISMLNSENSREPSTVIGDDNTDAVIQGTFKDEYSSVRILPTASNPTPKTYFYYRFKDKTGKPQAVPTTGLATGITSVTLTAPSFPPHLATDVNNWIQKEIEPAKDKQSEKEADWEIILNAANGFAKPDGTALPDGENWLDIRVADTAENISEIFNVRFLLDRTPPQVGSYEGNLPSTQFKPNEFIVASVPGYTGSSPVIPGPLPEMERVFSGTGASGDNTEAFSVSGRVNDANLSNLRISIGQDGFTSYTVTASVDIDLLKSSANPPNTGTGVTGSDDQLANGTDTGIKRLTLTGPYEAGSNNAYTSASTSTPEWVWTFKILKKDVFGLRDAAGIGTDAEYSTRRFIRVTASDKANKRAGPIEWAFYLDTKRPVIEYTNLDKGRNGSSFESDVKLSGLVSDDTRIKDVKYTIGRWNYTTKVWNWYDGANWNLTTPPAASTWASVFESATKPTRLTTMDFTITQATLTAAGATKFPANLFNTEGQYRIDLYVTDFSLGDGNAHNTTLADNTEGANGFKDYTTAGVEYNAKTGVGNVSARVFYIDKKDPTLRWATTIEDKTYFRNEDSGDDKGKAIFGFIAGDGNTLQGWTAVVKQGDTIVTSTSGTIKWDVGTGKTSQAIAEPVTIASNETTPATVAGNLISKTSIDEQYFVIKPFMTVDATAGGIALDVGKNPLPTYSITITVTDGAKRTSSITKQFTLDNTPPEFVKEKYLPLSYKFGDKDKPAASEGTPPAERVYSYDAITGRLNIRGNTTDNSNQIKSISYYVVNETDNPGLFTGTANFPAPADITTKNLWRSAKGAANTANAPEIMGSDGKTPLIQLDEGTLFAWRINLPQTSLFLTDDAVAVKHRQKATTGGTRITGGSTQATATQYRDVTINSNGTVTVTSQAVPALRFPDLNNPFLPATPTVIYGGEDVALITVYIRAEDAAGNVAYDALKYWVWPEGDRPIITAINNPDSSKIEIERLLNGTIRLSGMAKDNERVKYVWFRVLGSDGKTPYTNLKIPNWNETDWSEAAGTQSPVDGLTIGARRSDDPITAPTDGWYKANGGNSRDVGWWAYINTNGELDPTGTEESKKFTVEVRAQDVTYDDKNDKWMDYTSTYRGMASAMTTLSRVDAWVVAGAPIFENAFIAPDDSVKATNSTPQLWDTIDNISIRNRSSYKVTVKHNSGLSSIRWSPTFWDKSLTSGGITGAFQANPNLDAVNILDLNTNNSNPEYWYVYRKGTEAYDTAKMNQTTLFSSMSAATATNATPRMAVTVKPSKTPLSGTVSLSTTKRYMVWNWDIALETVGAFPYLVNGNHDTTHFDKDNKHKDKEMKYSVFTPATNLTNVNIGTAILIEAELDPPSTVPYFKWDVIVEVRADLLLADMIDDDSAYGNGTAARAGQVKNSVRYPLYLSASEVSKATPLTSRGDALLPIDNLRPYGMYTLNRKPAGTAVTIGGEAGDDGPVNGIARVVLWFQRKDGNYVSWHHQAPKPETTLAAVTDFKEWTANSGPAWWDAVGAPGAPAPNDVIPAGVKKPLIPAATATTGGDYAIVIDTNSPSKGIAKWGHTLPMGFADGGIGKLWYVEINSYGLESGPVELHYVVIDKAGNAKYYKERLIIMNNVAVIDRVKLATDIRHMSWTGTNLAGNKPMPSNNKIDDKATVLTPAQWPILNDLRKNIPFIGTSTDIKDDVKKGITDWISFSALGPDKVIDFNVRNNLFAMRVETTKGATLKARSFRLEYVSNARLMSDTNATGTKLTDIQAGRIYVINNRGTARWGMFGADGDDWKQGYAFIATVSGSELDDVAKANIGAGSAWELNPGYPAIGQRTSITPAGLQLADATYVLADASKAESAEFVYSNAAFPSIVDTNGPADVAWPPTGTTWTNANYSLFILRVFDGLESDLFGDFAILRVRVNNDDKTPPFAQLYDINPKTEGQERQNVAPTVGGKDNEQTRSVSPMFIGEGTNSNRTKGGLWNIATALGSVEKPGHIEPMRRNGTGYGTMYTSIQSGESAARNHSLSSAQLGGAATKESATIQKPWADPTGFFARDTVSGRVVLRGYAEDDQRVHQVVLTIGTTNITILDFQAHAASGAGAGTVGDTDSSSANYSPPLTGLLTIPTAQQGKVYFTDSIDAYRHRVEWAYIWDTETTNSGSVTGDNVSVQVTSYNRSGTTTARKTASGTIASPGTAHDGKSETARPNTSPYNKEFPVGLNKYNSITFNLRPYITGFLRNKSLFAHDTRSRQGWYMFARNETAVLKGFNLGTGNISIPGMANTPTSDVAAAAIGNYGITTANNNHYRQFTVGGSATTGSGLVTYSTAVNTGSERVQSGGRPTYIQPWNKEYSPGKDGTELWDDFTQVHIWQSNDTGPGSGDPGRFYVRDNGIILNPAMSIDATDGTLYESHNESGSGGNGWYNAGNTKKSGISSASNETVTQFSDPVFFSDVYRSPGSGSNGAYTWAVSSIIGRSGVLEYWRALGGIFINGAGGTGIRFHGGGTGSTDGSPSYMSDEYSKYLYHGESTWYNASANNTGRTASPPSTDQFMNPHIVTSYSGGSEHIHVSYYDDKDGSIKYRYNLRGSPGTIDLHDGSNSGAGGNTTNPTYNAANVNAIPKMWANLDGGFDQEDTDATTWISGTGTGGNIASGARVVRNGSRGTAIKAGKHNSIAVTSQGYPVIAYYDETNQRLKLAVSGSVSPVLANDWVIRDYVIPSDNKSSFGTGEFVSMKIDTINGTNQNRVHIAAMNTSKRLVYVTGKLNPPAAGSGNIQQTSGGVLTDVTVQVVDSVGSVGRWCALSLDSSGNPWISYMDESYVGSRDGVKVAFLNKTTFYKGVAGGTYFPGKYIDLYGASLEGWETMHVPTTYRVENPVEGPGREHGRLGMECFPTRNVTPTTNNKIWNGAVGYLSQDAAGTSAAMDRYRVAYYVK